MLSAFAIFCGAMLLGGCLVLMRDWLPSARWTQVEATVRGAVVEPVRQTHPTMPWRERDGFRPIIRYAYAVGEQTYVGSRYSATREPFFETTAQAQGFIESFPTRLTLPVRVNPADPRISLLERKLTFGDALPGYLALGCMLLGLLTL